MAAVKETLEEKKQVKETIEKMDKAKKNSEEEKEGAEEMDVDKQDEEVKEKVVKKVEDGGVGKEEEWKSDDGISPKTPGSRPTRERKTVERYFESLVARGSATKPLSIVKGQGTQLKDIPNVAYKLSKRKPDDNLQILHSILFGKKTKAHNLKKNIGLFSGYVWVENEQEKQRAKIKEKLDKCVKEKLLFFCDILNIPVSRSAAKKDELSMKLLDFLESPHSTTDSLLAEKEQKSKKRKSKGKTSKSTGSLHKAVGKSGKKHQKSEGEKRKQSPKIEEDESDDEPSSARDESGDDNDDEQANEVGSDHEESASEKEEDEVQEEEEEDDEEEEEEEEEEKPKKKKSNGNVSSKKDSGNKVTEKPKAVKKDNPAKSPKSSTKPTKVSSSTASKRGGSGADSIVTPKKQKVEKKSQQEENESVKENASNKKKSTKFPAKVSEKEGKEKSGKKAKAEPSNEEIHAAVVNILNEVDFNSATLSDIIRNLGSHFGVDLMHRKAEVKAIITDVINNMSDEEEGDDPEAENEEAENEGDDPEAENDEEKK
ncbi:DEK domain-containing chromatin-associated protein 1-like isoform X1 [Solanum dulcamara]|uniref:DEK domain-containing chromatin-associated protein 1-like isoform X1 n=1 Tax=Solanum dulcamara TaxID=45834 RepID=UPI00248685D4|nr:DEK domain-containing chromatin-associated protein 1-like isoform X1 [Solanum dulcamara]